MLKVPKYCSESFNQEVQILISGLAIELKPRAQFPWRSCITEHCPPVGAASQTTVPLVELQHRVWSPW